jgi:8-oxo-dGTP pyrophosphatase MutT (NUDIX family)
MSDFSVPSKASTVIVVRPESNGGFGVLMTRRPQHMQFLGGYLVFPGGGIEKEDYSERMLCRCRGLSPVEAQEKLGGEMSPELSLGHWVAAVRELFEEAGVHFFVNQNDDAAEDDVEKRLAEKRKDLSEGRINLPQLLESEQLFCDLSRLTYLFHRTTPEKYKLRFDTRFYLASLPENQSALAFSEEVAESFWLPPRAALDQSESSKFPMLPPTIIALRTLAEHDSWNALRAAFRLR